MSRRWRFWGDPTPAQSFWPSSHLAWCSALYSSSTPVDRSNKKATDLFAEACWVSKEPSLQVEWRCGPYKILLGCDLVVMQSAETQLEMVGVVPYIELMCFFLCRITFQNCWIQECLSNLPSEEKCDPTDFASFKMLPDGSGALPSRDDRLDMYLENMMCDISKDTCLKSTIAVRTVQKRTTKGSLGTETNAKVSHDITNELGCTRELFLNWRKRELLRLRKVPSAVLHCTI